MIPEAVFTGMVWLAAVALLVLVFYLAWTILGGAG